MKEYTSIKIFDGYSTAFRQWKATHSHCQYIHGYALKFKVWFIGEIDEKNWVCDFGCFKRNGIKQELANQFDHTTVVAIDDPHMEMFKKMNAAISANLLRPVVDKTYEFSEARAAFRSMGEDKHFGKIVIMPHN